MTPRKRQRQLDPLSRLRQANPAPSATMGNELGEGHLAAAMRAAVALGEAGEGSSPRVGRRPRRGFALAGALCGVAAIALAVLLIGTPGSSREPAYAAAAIRVAESNPRLLVTASGWTVARAGEFETDEGEVNFADGTHTFDVHWYPASAYERYLEDRAQVSPPERSELLGLTATTVRYQPGEYATMLAPEGPVFVEVRGNLGSREAYDEILASLRRVDVDTWLAAMPPSVVRPEARATEVERLLRGVQLPLGFNASSVTNSDRVADDYQLAVEVANAVSCGWVEAWLAARQAGDSGAAREAVAAMSAARHWPLMDELRAVHEGGGWSMNIESIVRQLESGQLEEGPAGASINPDGSGYELGPAWAVAIECRSHYWRRPLGPGTSR
jgi:hypothetical protein